MYDGALGRWFNVDPLAEEYYSFSVFNYCLNNPARYIDPDGRAPGDKFMTLHDAAKDWGKYYNGASIVLNLEFGSTIYFKSDKNGGGYYSYSVANIGTRDKVTPSTAPGNSIAVSNIHSHGAWMKEYVAYFPEVKELNLKGIIIDGNETYNSNDKYYDYNSDQRFGFLATPNGVLKRYDTVTTKVEDIDYNMPSDPNSPYRRNNIAAIFNNSLVANWKGFYDKARDIINSLIFEN